MEDKIMSRKTSAVELRRLRYRSKKKKNEKPDKVLSNLLDVNSDVDLRKIIEERLKE